MADAPAPLVAAPPRPAPAGAARDGVVIFAHACQLGCEGIVSKRLRSPYRSKHWRKVKNPAAPAVRREAEEDWLHREGAQKAYATSTQNIHFHPLIRCRC